MKCVSRAAVSVAVGLAALAGTSNADAATATWRSGAFVDNPFGAAGVQEFADYRGRPVDVAITYVDRSSWSEISNPWTVAQYAGFRGRLDIGLPLTVGSTPLSEVAAGDYDTRFADFARMLIDQGRRHAIIRLGWEFNGDWYPWSAYDPTTYKAAFRHVVDLLRSVVPGVSIDWNGNLGSSQCGHDPFTELYPGDDYVNIIGVDAYDTQWAGISDAASFDAWASWSHGLNDWYAFAQAHGKRLSVPEWGVAAPPSAGSGEGDNAVYIQGMHDWFTAHAAGLKYEAYFNDEQPDTANSLDDPNEMPKSSATYASLWGVTDGEAENGDSS